MQSLYKYQIQGTSILKLIGMFFHYAFILAHKHRLTVQSGVLNIPKHLFLETNGKRKGAHSIKNLKF